MCNEYVDDTSLTAVCVQVKRLLGAGATSKVPGLPDLPGPGGGRHGAAAARVLAVQMNNVHWHCSVNVSSCINYELNENKPKPLLSTHVLLY